LNPFADGKYLVKKVGAMVDAHGAYLDGVKAEMAGEEKIQTGLDSVRLGPSVKPAALATWSTCIGDKHHLVMKEGSSTVLLGPGQKPMSRRTDGTTCNGKITQGLSSALVGG
jgi:hypothetical protein